MKNIPNQIYLQVGDKCPDDADFNGLSEVTWCKDKINVNDIAYIRRDRFGLTTNIVRREEREKAIKALDIAIMAVLEMDTHNVTMDELRGQFKKLLNN